MEGFGTVTGDGFGTVTGDRLGIVVGGGLMVISPKYLFEQNKTLHLLGVFSLLTYLAN